MAAAPRKTVAYRLDRWLRERDRQVGDYDRTRRFREVVLGVHGGRDWPHRLMALVGRDDCGNWSPPRGRDLYMRIGWERRADRTAIEGTQNQRVHTTHGMTAWDGVRRGEEWRTFDWQDDGHTLRIGWLGDDGRIHDSGLGSVAGEVALFRRWFLWDSWIKFEWLGLRRWIYYQGLHRAVHRKYPWTCQAVTPPGTGGYNHWYCQVPIGRLGTVRRWLGWPVEHPMPHRYNNYRWDGQGNRVKYEPVAAQ
jgi:catechol 2,3-dioxygenase-like lactoylglutathione lyase family enzyme